MIVGFKGNASKLKNLYKELGLTEKTVESIEDLSNAIKENDGKTVIVNYNDVMVYDNATADIVEKKNKIMKQINGTKKNLYLGLLKHDTSIDKVKLDVAVSTKVNTKEMSDIEALYEFVNTDLPYNGKLADDDFVVRHDGVLRGEAMNMATLKKLLK